MKTQNLLFLFCFALCGVLSAQERIYFNDFETGDLEVDEYVGDPEISDNISFSVWTNDAGGFVEQEGVNGSKGISILGNGTKSIFFEIEIKEGFQLNITNYNFWAKKTKANQGWTFLMNDVIYAEGQTEFDGSFITGDFDPPFLNQTGTVNVEFRVNGMGNGNYIVDNFELLGSVTPICDEELIDIQPQDQAVCREDNAEFSVTPSSEENKTYQWQVLVDGEWENLIDNEFYQNVNSSTLSIVITTDDLNQNDYRCIVTEDECEEISDAATLTVIPLPETQPILFND